MDDDEVRSFLDSAKTAILTTLDARGWPHSVAMWFVPPGALGPEIRMWTYRKSQKAKNLLRDARAAFLVESGSGYGDLRGVLVRARIEIVDNFDTVRTIGTSLHERYVAPLAGEAQDEAIVREIERQARKRVGLLLPLQRVASWDHRKL